MIARRKHAQSIAACVLLAAGLTFAGCDAAADLGLTAPQLPVSAADLTSRPAPTARDVCADPPNAAAIIQDALDLINAERAKEHLRPVRLDPTLSQIADFYAGRMIDADFFAHEDPFDGSTVDTRATDFGYAYRKVGENLAAGHQTAGEAVAHWMRSSGHRANLLDPAFVDVGLAVKTGGEYGVYWVLELGRPMAIATHDPAATKPADRAADSDSAAPPIARDTLDTAADGQDASNGPSPAATSRPNQ